MGERCDFTIAAWGTVEKVMTVVSHLVNSLDVKPLENGAGYFVKQDGPYALVKEWTHYPNCYRWREDIATHNAVLETVAATMGLEVDLPGTPNRDSVLVIRGESNWEPPIGWLKAISEQFPSMIFELWSDIAFIREDWWLANGGHIYPLLIYNGASSVFAGEKMSAIDFIELAGDGLPCLFGDHNAWQ